MNALAAGETLDAQSGAWGLEKLQRLIDQFNARREMIYNVAFTRFTLQANHSPHTIGPAPSDFNMNQRPVKIVGATLLLSASSQVVDTPISIRDDDWWLSNPVKDQTSTLCTDLYYSADSPLGNCYFWPKVNTVNDVRLETWTSIQQAVSLSSPPITMPQGYWDALVTELAMQLCPSFEKEPSAALIRNNRQAMSAILDNNAEPPRISTAGAGIPDSSIIRTGRPDYNFLTGLRE